MDTLRVPLKFNGDKTAAVYTEGSDEYYAQLLALAAQIRPRELVLTPTYGCEDPTFFEESRRSLAFTAATFIPEIQIVDINISSIVNGESSIDISFDIRE